MARTPASSRPIVYRCIRCGLLTTDPGEIFHSQCGGLFLREPYGFAEVRLLLGLGSLVGGFLTMLASLMLIPHVSEVWWLGLVAVGIVGVVVGVVVVLDAHHGPASANAAYCMCGRTWREHPTWMRWVFGGIYGDE